MRHDFKSFIRIACDEMPTKSYTAMILAVAVIAGAFLLLAYGVWGSATFLVALTDPPIVPAGTQALMVS